MPAALARPVLDLNLLARADRSLEWAEAALVVAPQVLLAARRECLEDPQWRLALTRPPMADVQPATLGELEDSRAA